MDTRPKTASGKRIGRPKIRHEKLTAIATRCPNSIYIYLKGITPFRYSSLTEMFNDMLTRFINEAPWKSGLLWRKPKSVISRAGGAAGATGWDQINILMDEQSAERVKLAAQNCGVSTACFCYTAIYWWVTYVFPPAKFKLN